jgi:hypothetical protein
MERIIQSRPEEAHEMLSTKIRATTTRAAHTLAPAFPDRVIERQQRRATKSAACRLQVIASDGKRAEIELPEIVHEVRCMQRARINLWRSGVMSMEEVAA